MLTVHVDDFMQEVEDEDQEKLARQLAIGGRRLATTLQKELKLTIALDKCALAASTPQVAALVRKQLQSLAGSATVSRARATILGVEAAAGSRAPMQGQGSHGQDQGPEVLQGQAQGQENQQAGQG